MYIAAIRVGEKGQQFICNNIFLILCSIIFVAKEMLIALFTHNKPIIDCAGLLSSNSKNYSEIF